ncbi:MAG: CCA tRNA nucleotidyltransferase [Caulobacteraceae bacterium]
MKTLEIAAIPKEVIHIIDTLNEHKFQAFIVGGCVRDSLLGRKPTDWDIATNAKPEEVKGIFEKTIDTGIKHGTVTVIYGNAGFEITTFRVDGVYLDYRKPESVEFTASIEEDLARRDFTVNSIAFNLDEGLVDPYNGIEDIDNKTIRAVGNPDKRFNEDALRMLRAVRFSAQLGFEIDEKTLESIGNNSELIKNISSERIRDELTKILLSDNPFVFSLLMETKLLKYILPEFTDCYLTLQNNPYHVYNVAVHILTSVAWIEKDRILRWAMLLHDIGKPSAKTTDEKNIDHFYNHQQKSVQIAKNVLDRLRFDNKSADTILRLIRHHDISIKPEAKSVRKAVSRVGDDIFPDLLKVIEADKKAQNPKYFTERSENLKKIRELYREIKEQGQCTSLKELAVNGSDLLSLGFRQGQGIKTVLEALLEKVIETPELNNRESLINIAEKMKRSLE